MHAAIRPDNGHVINTHLAGANGMIRRAGAGARHFDIVLLGFALGAGEMFGRHKFPHGAAVAHFLGNFDPFNVAFQIIGLGKGIGIDNWRIRRIGRPQGDRAP